MLQTLPCSRERHECSLNPVLWKALLPPPFSHFPSHSGSGLCTCAGPIHLFACVIWWHPWEYRIPRPGLQQNHQKAAQQGNLQERVKGEGHLHLFQLQPCQIWQQTLVTFMFFGSSFVQLLQLCFQWSQRIVARGILNTMWTGCGTAWEHSHPPQMDQIFIILGEMLFWWILPIQSFLKVDSCFLETNHN